jgi:tetratricopeptide (TPR) repeat protein
MKKGVVTLFAVGAGLTLSGCQSFPLFHSARARVSAPVAAERYIQLGREQLDGGQTGAAIDTFRVALAVGEDPAAAVNGLGVAYTRLGRFDAAETLFAKAAQLDPANVRYTRNLARIESSRASLALAAADRLASAAPILPDQPPQERPGQAIRIAPGEVRIHSAALPSGGVLPVVAVRARQKDAGAAEKGTPEPARPAADKALATVDSRFKPLVRVALRAPTAAHSAASARPSTLTSKPRVAVNPGFAPIVRVEFANADGARNRSKVVVIAAR